MERFAGCYSRNQQVSLIRSGLYPACVDHSCERAVGGSTEDEANFGHHFAPVSDTQEDVVVAVVAPGSELVDGHTPPTAVADFGSMLIQTTALDLRSAMVDLTGWHSLHRLPAVEEVAVLAHDSRHIDYADISRPMKMYRTQPN